MRQYRAYVRTISNKLEKLPPDKFQPSLKLFDDLITSIEVDGNADRLMKQQ
jgi:hypothetical protein